MHNPCRSRISQFIVGVLLTVAVAGSVDQAKIALGQQTREKWRTINMRLTPTWVDADNFYFLRETIGGSTEKVSVNAVTGQMSVAAPANQAGSTGLVGGPIPRSEQSGVTTTIQFFNQTDQTVQLKWIAYDGTRRNYDTIPPGQKLSRQTYIGHAWIVIGKSDQSYFGSVVAGPADIVHSIKTVYPDPTRRNDVKPPNNPQPARNLPRPDVRIHSGTLQIRKTADAQWQPLGKPISGNDGQQLVNAQVSPDGEVAIVWKKTSAKRLLVHRIESSPAGGGRANLLSSAYSLPGDPKDSYELLCFATSTGERLAINLPVFDFGTPTIRWRNDHELLIEKVDRGHQRFRLFAVDPITQIVRTPIDEISDTFIWTTHAPNRRLVTYLENHDAVIYSSEMHGWRHLYWVDLNGDSPPRPITQGDWVVREILSIDEDQQTLDLMVSGINPEQDPYFQHLIRIGFDGDNLVRLTAGNGDHQIQFSPDRRYLIDTYSRVDMPPVHELRRVSDGTFIATLAAAQRLSGDTPTTAGLPTVFTAKGRDGQTDIWGFVSFPSDFDPNAAGKYPVIENIYAGPHGSHVPKRYSRAAFDQDLTDAGFVVVRIDGMGTANRSKAFHDVCWQNLKDAGFPDRIAWIKAAAEKYPALDLDRVGIFGTSAGGQNACGALLFHGDFYQAAMAACGCHDNRMDKSSWNEQWMGYPVGPHYAASSNIEHAARLQGDLLLIVGELDSNVPPESTYRLVDALIKADKGFDFLMVPGGGHGSGGRYGRRRMRDFFIEKLEAKPLNICE